MQFVEIFPGSFLMGSPEDEAERHEDETRHSVELTLGFWMGVHQVTQDQWRAVMKSSPSIFKGPDLPVENVTWHNCQTFCEKLSKKEGKPYRLPTEAQWEYACRAGTATPYWFGRTISTDQANYDGNQVYGEGLKGVFRQTTTPVGSFPANPWGLHDMHGNVWERCEEAYGPYAPGGQVDPLVKSPPAARVVRVVRGGSWRSRPHGCRCACRSRIAPAIRGNSIGLRVCLDF